SCAPPDQRAGLALAIVPYALLGAVLTSPAPASGPSGRRRSAAYRQPTMWDDRGDNPAAVTTLHIVVNREFRQVGEIDVDGHSTIEEPEQRYFEVECREQELQR